MASIKNILLVASGKGGVGKSTVATNLALALHKGGQSVGLLDADIYGPSIPTMLGDAGRPGSPDGKRIYAIEKYGIKLMSMGYMVDPDQAMVWRGPMLAGAVLQFVNDVEWGELDYLVFDLPPGTGDIQLSIAQKLKVNGAVLVTTPQQVAVADVIRAKAMFDRVRIPTLGVIENMSYFIAPDTGNRYEIFGSGGGHRAAEQLGIRFFGQVPIEQGVAAAGDAGEPIVLRDPNTASAQAFSKISAEIQESLAALRAEQERAQGPRKRLQIIQ